MLMISLFFVNCKETAIKIEPSNHSVIQKNVDEYFSALTQIGKFNGVIYVSKNGEALINKAYNLNLDKKSSTYVTVESQFDIHSVSKLMTHYLILKLEHEGKINRKDLLSDFIANFPKGNEITIEMLLNHTSGLPREFVNFKRNQIDLSPAEIIEIAKHQTLIFEPGQEKQYSNIGYQILYYIIGSTANKSFEQYLTDELFLPLKMDDSGAHFYTKENIKNLAFNHEQEDTAIVQVENVLEGEFKQARIFSTANDLNKFLTFIQSDSITAELADENSIIQHSGGSDGIRAHVYTKVDNKISFVLLANYDGIPFQKTIQDLVKIIEEKPYVVPQELNRQSISLTNDILQKYNGEYIFADMNNLILKIELESDYLIVFQDGEKIGELAAENDSTFFENPKEPESFEFIQNDKGVYNLFMGWKGVKLKGIKKSQ